jgi:hypothetical protein
MRHDIHQGYADRELPAQPVTLVATLVSAPLPLSESLQASIAEQAAKIGIVVDGARTIFPPTRQYTDAQIKRDLATQSVGAVLVVTVGDSGMVREYAGTVFSGSYSGIATANFGGVTYGGTSTGFASPAYRFRSRTDFSARLIEASSGRKLCTLGYSVALVYLGFLRADEMREDKQEPFEQSSDWRKAVEEHSALLFSAGVWNHGLTVHGSTFVPIITSRSVPLATRFARASVGAARESQCRPSDARSASGY